jgi:thioredoxin-related protein
MKKILSICLISLFAASAFAQSAPNSGTVMAAAYKQAAKENKNVIVIFHASWCGWCKKMDASMADPTTKKYFDDNYVTVHLDVQEKPEDKKLENPGADVFLAKYKGEKAGLPFFLIMDSKGTELGNSFVDGANMGCPASPAEADSFAGLLRKTSKIDDEGLKAIIIRFRQNEAKE